jgi:hypothetical protein
MVFTRRRGDVNDAIAAGFARRCRHRQVSGIDRDAVMIKRRTGNVGYR